MANGINEMGLSQSHSAIDEEWVVVLARMIGNRARGGVGELITRSDDKSRESVVGNKPALACGSGRVCPTDFLIRGEKFSLRLTTDVHNNLDWVAQNAGERLLERCNEIAQ